MSKNNTFSASIFKGFGLRFRRIFWWFFQGSAELISNCEWKLRALKIVILLRQNAYFQENLGRKYVEFIRKKHEKTLFFWTFDLEGFFVGFGKGFGMPKSSFFALFSMVFRSHFWSAFRKAKKSTKMSQQGTESANLGLGSGGPQAPGEGLEGGETRKSHETLATRCSMLVSGVWCWGWSILI